MIENNYEAKQSIKMIIIACISDLIMTVFLSGISILFLFMLMEDDITFDNLIGLSICLSWSVSLIIICIIILIYIIFTYKYQTDIYTKDKLIRKKGKRVIFELPYKNIVAIKEGYYSIFFVLSSPIVKMNGKKGPRNFYEHYSRQDIYRIKQIIFSKNFNL